MGQHKRSFFNGKGGSCVQPYWEGYESAPGRSGETTTPHQNRRSTTDHAATPSTPKPTMIYLVFRALAHGTDCDECIVPCLTHRRGVHVPALSAKVDLAPGRGADALQVRLSRRPPSRSSREGPFK